MMLFHLVNYSFTIYPDNDYNWTQPRHKFQIGRTSGHKLETGKLMTEGIAWSELSSTNRALSVNMYMLPCVTTTENKIVPRVH